MARFVAGVDCSTQSTKVLIVDPDDGRVVAAGRAAHEVTGTGGARETHPEVWWRALRDALAQTGRAGEVVALSVGGQQHGLVVLGGDGAVLRPAALWNDTRAAGAARDLVAALGGSQEWAERVGVVPVAAITVSKWAWLRAADPRAADTARAVRLPHDFLTERLTGRATTDRGDASGTGWWSTAAEDYAADVLDLDLVRLDPALLPEVLGPDEPAGPVTPAAAEVLGLPADVVVGPGTGDNMAAALGLGVGAGVPVVSLGTSGTAYAVSDRRAADPSGEVAGFADATGRFLPLACTLNCTLAVDRAAAWLGVDREAVEPGGDVVVLPFLDGERTPDLPRAAGTITGLRHDSTRGQILRATYEGAVLSLLDALDRLHRWSSGLMADAPVVLIGGGARGAAWREVVARLSGRPLQIPDAEELVALGAAAQAAAVLSGEAPDAVAGRWDLLRGTTVEAVERDEDALERHRHVRALTAALNGSSPG
ncbi:MAG: xylulokinase [Euzebyaceae bacterium]|jgi:xylulokinase|nr:xylulokinase [Euzebyaceae bacterium]